MIDKNTTQRSFDFQEIGEQQSKQPCGYGLSFHRSYESLRQNPGEIDMHC